MSLQPHHILLTVVAGESRALQRELAWGVPLARLSVGAGADWAIRGEGILDVHFHLSFDGRRLRAVAASPLAKVFAHGAELGCEWEDVLLPCELSFGSARLAGHVVGNAASRPSLAGFDFAPGQGRRTQPLDLARSDGLQTQLLDLSTLRDRPVDAHVTLSIDGAGASEPSAPLPQARQLTSVGAPSAPSPSSPPRAAGAPRAASASMPSFQIVSGSTLAWSLGNLAVQPRAERLPPAEPEPAPRTEPKPLATPRPEPPSTPRSTPLTHTQCDGGALHDYARQLAAQRPEATQAGSTPPTAATPLALRLGSLLTRAWVGARMAAESAPRWQLWLGLSALATLMLLPLWATPSDEVHGNGNGETALQARLPTPDESALPTVNGSAALEAAELAKSAGRSESRRVGPSRVAARADSDSSRSPAEVPRADAITAADGTAADGTAADRTAADRTAAPASGEATPSSALEHDAFRAAFGGNLGEAIPLYEELAKQRREPVFEHAARLLRENRVHKP